MWSTAFVSHARGNRHRRLLLNSASDFSLAAVFRRQENSSARLIRDDRRSSIDFVVETSYFLVIRSRYYTLLSGRRSLWYASCDDDNSTYPRTAVRSGEVYMMDDDYSTSASAAISRRHWRHKWFWWRLYIYEYIYIKKKESRPSISNFSIRFRKMSNGLSESVSRAKTTAYDFTVATKFSRRNIYF